LRKYNRSCLITALIAENKCLKANTKLFERRPVFLYWTNDYVLDIQ